jgi:hypothetical protein
MRMRCGRVSSTERTRSAESRRKRHPLVGVGRLPLRAASPHSATLATEQIYTVLPSGSVPMYVGIASHVMLGSSAGEEQKNHSFDASGAMSEIM